MQASNSRPGRRPRQPASRPSHLQVLQAPPLCLERTLRLCAARLGGRALRRLRVCRRLQLLQPAALLAQSIQSLLAAGVGLGQRRRRVVGLPLLSVAG